jgi:SNW domain-containing protein 1
MPSKAPVSHDSLFDQRLFGQTKGLDSGLGTNDDSYNVYDKPWREGGSAADKVYRPSRNMDKDIYGDDVDKLMKTSKFVPDKGFSGADPSQRRNGPVQFEREPDDPFGLNLGFLTDAKKAKRPTEDRDSSKSKRSKH